MEVLELEAEDVVTSSMDIDEVTDDSNNSGSGAWPKRD